MDRQQLREKAMALPLKPGVYIMKNKQGDIIYIGKAKALKNRVSQYFGSDRNHPEKVRRMVSQVDHFDYILVGSEFEALVLECSLIKQHQPKYNILLKDDKGYCYIRISSGDWRRISFEMQKKPDNAVYLGPYMSAYYARSAVEAAQKIFRLPSCSRSFPRDIGKGRPCLNYHIKQCCAPCRGRVRQEDYDESVEAAIDFLKHGGTECIKEMTQQMEEASERMDYEQAAVLRDRIAAVKKITEKQKVVAAGEKDQDVIAVMTEGGSGCFAVLRFQEGRLYDKEDFLIKDLGEEPDLAGARTEFLQQYYSLREYVPPVITVDGEVQDSDVLLGWLSEKRGRPVKLLVPQRGEKREIVQMCRDNAAETLAQQHGHLGHELTALTELAALLGLPQVPKVIESYDISHTAGSDNVAGMVVFRDGRPLKKNYRRFQIQSVSGQDDYGSLKEVLTRRFAEYFREKDSGEGFGLLPDLILLDGGKGQVSAVRPVLEYYGLNIPLFGMVKDSSHRTRAITDEGREISITSKRSAFTLVSSIQEEVHRFAVSYHRQKHGKRNLHLSLLEIEGIGPSRASALLGTFKTIKRISEADVEELMQVKGMTQPAAEAVYRHFRKLT